ncbi:MAG: hypothetical protein ACR2LQ_07935 [Acidimicrobiales bacterium]
MPPARITGVEGIEIGEDVYLLEDCGLAVTPPPPRHWRPRPLRAGRRDRVHAGLDDLEASGPQHGDQREGVIAHQQLR